MNSSSPSRPPPEPAGPEGGPVASFLRSRSGGSAETVKTYGKRLARYAAWHGDDGIDRESYDRYVSVIKRQGRRPNGIALDARVLLLYAEHREVNTKGWQRVKMREVPTNYLKPNELELLRRGLLASPRDAEDRAFYLTFSVGTGLRIAEFQSLRWNDLDLEEGRLIVRGGKGSKSRTIPLPWDGPEIMVRALESAQARFWRCYPSLTLAEGRLITDKVSPWDNAWRIENFLREAARRAGLSGLQVHPHLARHTFATILVQEGVPAPTIQKLLGHASLQVTSRYVQAQAMDIVRDLQRAGKASL